MIDVSRERVEERLRELPDGEFRAVDFLEHDGEANRLYKLDLRMRKRGARLRFDFSGSSRQAPGFINATRSGLEGGVTARFFPCSHTIFPGIRAYAHGRDRRARRPYLYGAVPGSSRCSDRRNDLGRLECVFFRRSIDCWPARPSIGNRAQAVSDGTMATFNLGGRNQYGEAFGLHLMDPLAADMPRSQPKTAMRPGDR